MAQGQRSPHALPGPAESSQSRRRRYSHGKVVDEALPAGGALQEVVDAALDVSAREQRAARAVDGDARVEAHRRPRAKVGGGGGRGGRGGGRGPRGAWRSDGRVERAARRAALGQLQREGALLGQARAAPPGARQAAPAPALSLGPGRGGGRGHGQAGPAGAGRAAARRAEAKSAAGAQCGRPLLPAGPRVRCPPRQGVGGGAGRGRWPRAGPGGWRAPPRAGRPAPNQRRRMERGRLSPECAHLLGRSLPRRRPPVGSAPLAFTFSAPPAPSARSAPFCAPRSAPPTPTCSPSPSPPARPARSPQPSQEGRRGVSRCRDHELPGQEDGVGRRQPLHPL